MFSAWTFCLPTMLLCAFLITLDRYIYITKALNYVIIMTRKRIALGIFLSWAIPFAVLAVGIFLLDDDSDEIYCIVTHHHPKAFILFGVTFALTTLVGFYTLYSFILVKFFKQKRKLERAKTYKESVRLVGSPKSERFPAPSRRPSVSNNLSSTASDFNSCTVSGINVDHEIKAKDEKNVDIKTGVTIDAKAFAKDPAERKRSRLKQQDSSKKLLHKLVSVGKFLHAAQYVIVLLIVFTLAWMPWIFCLLTDILGNDFGNFRGFPVIPFFCHCKLTPKTTKYYLKIRLLLIRIFW